MQCHDCGFYDYDYKTHSTDPLLFTDGRDGNWIFTVIKQIEIENTIIEYLYIQIQSKEYK